MKADFLTYSRSKGLFAGTAGNSAPSREWGHQLSLYQKPLVDLL